MRAMMAAAVAVVVAMTMGALATRARAASALLGMAPSAAATTDKNSTAALKQLLLETKAGAGARMGPHLYILQKAYGAQPLWHDGGLRAKLPPLRVQDGYVRVSAYGDDVSALKTPCWRSWRRSVPGVTQSPRPRKRSGHSVLCC